MPLGYWPCLRRNPLKVHTQNNKTQNLHSALFLNINWKQNIFLKKYKKFLVEGLSCKFQLTSFHCFIVRGFQRLLRKSKVLLQILFSSSLTKLFVEQPRLHRVCGICIFYFLKKLSTLFRL